ncbi:hypothetical protein L3Q82_026691 [Scortum barcoo]|uniref:Uncharacterized protein n=1 Tax=Scortum barcoo TaxID=214431 RepID=A0ACB8WJB7_9TELE|nr:hypothetical protein L3Q82_026691 [Scortum barcoo]
MTNMDPADTVGTQECGMGTFRMITDLVNAYPGCNRQQKRKALELAIDELASDPWLLGSVPGLFGELLTALGTLPAKLRLAHLPRSLQPEPRPAGFQPALQSPSLQPWSLQLPSLQLQPVKSKPQLQLPTAERSRCLQPQPTACCTQLLASLQSSLQGCQVHSLRSSQPAPRLPPSLPPSLQPPSQGFQPGFQPAPQPACLQASGFPACTQACTQACLHPPKPAPELSGFRACTQTGTTRASRFPACTSVSQPSACGPAPEPSASRAASAAAQPSSLQSAVRPAVHHLAFNLRPSFWFSGRRVLSLSSSAAGSPATESQQPAAPESELPSAAEPETESELAKRPREGARGRNSPVPQFPVPSLPALCPTPVGLVGLPRRHGTLAEGVRRRRSPEEVRRPAHQKRLCRRPESGGGGSCLRLSRLSAVGHGKAFALNPSCRPPKGSVFVARRLRGFVVDAEVPVFAFARRPPEKVRLARRPPERIRLCHRPPEASSWRPPEGSTAAEVLRLLRRRRPPEGSASVGRRRSRSPSSPPPSAAESSCVRRRLRRRRRRSSAFAAASPVGARSPSRAFAAAPEGSPFRLPPPGSLSIRASPPRRPRSRFPPAAFERRPSPPPSRPPGEVPNRRRLRRRRGSSAGFVARLRRQRPEDPNCRFRPSSAEAAFTALASGPAFAAPVRSPLAPPRSGFYRPSAATRRVPGPSSRRLPTRRWPPEVRPYAAVTWPPEGSGLRLCLRLHRRSSCFGLPKGSASAVGAGRRRRFLSSSSRAASKGSPASIAARDSSRRFARSLARLRILRLHCRPLRRFLSSPPPPAAGHRKVPASPPSPAVRPPEAASPLPPASAPETAFTSGCRPPESRLCPPADAGFKAFARACRSCLRRRGFRRRAGCQVFAFTSPRPSPGLRRQLAPSRPSKGSSLHRRPLEGSKPLEGFPASPSPLEFPCHHSQSPVTQRFSPPPLASHEGHHRAAGHQRRFARRPPPVGLRLRRWPPEGSGPDLRLRRRRRQKVPAFTSAVPAFQGSQPSPSPSSPPATRGTCRFGRRRPPEGFRFRRHLPSEGSGLRLPCRRPLEEFCLLACLAVAAIAMAAGGSSRLRHGRRLATGGIQTPQSLLPPAQSVPQKVQPYAISCQLRASAPIAIASPLTASGPIHLPYACEARAVFVSQLSDRHRALSRLSPADPDPVVCEFTPGEAVSRISYLSACNTKTDRTREELEIWGARRGKKKNSARIKWEYTQLCDMVPLEMVGIQRSGSVTPQQVTGQTKSGSEAHHEKKNIKDRYVARIGCRVMGPHPGARPGVGALRRAPGGRVFAHGTRPGSAFEMATWARLPVGSPPCRKVYEGARCNVGHGMSPHWGGRSLSFVREVERYRLEIVGLTSSTHSLGSGTQLLERGWTLHYSGVAQGERRRAGGLAHSSPAQPPTCWSSPR